MRVELARVAETDEVACALAELVDCSWTAAERRGRSERAKETRPSRTSLPAEVEAGEGRQPDFRSCYFVLSLRLGCVDIGRPGFIVDCSAASPASAWEDRDGERSGGSAVKMELLKARAGSCWGSEAEG